MRFPLLLLCLSCGSAAAWGQIQEKKLADRVLSPPNMALVNAMQGKSFYDGKSALSSRTAQVQDFYLPQRFGVKEFATRNFQSSSYWQGDLLFATQEARTKTDSRDLKLFATKAAEVKDARESGKTYEIRNFAVTPEFVPDGKSQKSLDQAKKEKMTIDQVRELLNKNK